MTSNEAAERLLYFIKLWSSPATAKQLNSLTDEALAAERRATVERIRERIGALAEIPFEPGPYTDGWRGAVKDALYWLDEEAAR